MTTLSPVHLYEAGLASLRLWVHDLRGRRARVPVADWTARSVPGDASLLTRCRGLTLDVGCGPGRLVTALATRGIEALGIDISAGVVAKARGRGVNAIHGSVFGPVPAAGRWSFALLADGNIGIGGDPAALLRRIRGLLAPRGLLHVELAAPGAPTQGMELRLEDETGRISEWFPWAEVGVDGISALAADTGLAVTERWESAGRWFASLRKVDMASW